MSIKEVIIQEGKLEKKHGGKITFSQKVSHENEVTTG